MSLTLSTTDHPDSPVIYPIRRIHWLILCALLVVAYIPRAGDGLAYERFRYDHATLSTLALEMSYDGQFPLLGIESSAGVPNSPMTVYLLALPFALSDNPQVVMWFLALLNVLSVGILWAIGHRYFGAWVGFFVGLAYACSPYAIGFSRGIWAQNYHTPLILLAILLGLLGFLERKRWAQVLCLPVFVAGVQIHFAAWTLIPLYGIFLWWGRRHIVWRDLFLSALLVCLVMLPFILGILGVIQTGGETSAETTGRFGRIMALIREGVPLQSEPLSILYDLTGGIGSDGMARNGRDAFALQMPYPQVFAMFWCVIASVGGIALWVKHDWRRYALFFWGWVWLTVLIFIPAWTGTDIFHHYYAPTVPAVMFLLGLGIVVVLEGVQRLMPAYLSVYFRYGLALVFMSLLAYQGVYRLQLHQFVNDHYVYSETSLQTATPIHYLLDVRDALNDFDDVVLFGANPHETNHYIWSPLLHNTARCVRDFQIEGGGMFLQPAGRFGAVLASPSNAYAMPTAYINMHEQVIALRPDEAPYTIYDHADAPVWDGMPINDLASQQFANGVILNGYALADGLLVVRWQLPTNTDGIQYSYYGHFLNDAGERIGQRDTAFYAPQFWCAGDTLTTWVTTDIPPGTTTLRLGMYQLMPDGGTQGVDIVDEVGRTRLTYVDIALE